MGTALYISMNYYYVYRMVEVLCISMVPILIAPLGLRIFLLFITLFFPFISSEAVNVMRAQDNESKDTNGVGLQSDSYLTAQREP